MAKRDSRNVQARIDRFVALSRDRGLRVTAQRLEVLRELAAADDHPSAEDLCQRLRERMPTVSLDTVYRTLVTLQEFGLVGRVEVLDDRSRFDGNLDPHHHLVCVRCRKVVDLCWPDFDRLGIPEAARGWGEVRQAHAELRGTCADCIRRGASGPR